MSEINFLLGEGPGEHRAQELKSEYELYRDQVREIERTLNPPAEDAELAALQAASISQQIEQAKRDHAPAPADIVEERKRNAAQRREALLELQFAEQSEVLRHQILRWDQQGEYAQSKRLRVQLTNLRADLEKQFPA